MVTNLGLLSSSSKQLGLGDCISKVPVTIFWNQNQKDVKKFITPEQTRTQSPLIYSRKGIWKSNLSRAKALGKEGGKVTSLRVFLPSFPWCTANSLNPSHKSQRIQRSDWVQVWLPNQCIILLLMLVNVNPGLIQGYYIAFCAWK